MLTFPIYVAPTLSGNDKKNIDSTNILMAHMVIVLFTRYIHFRNQ